VAIALAGNWNWLHSTERVKALESLGLDLTSNVVPLEPYLYFNPIGVNRYYLKLRHRKLRYFVAKAR